METTVPSKPDPSKHSGDFGSLLRVKDDQGEDPPKETSAMNVLYRRPL